MAFQTALQSGDYDNLRADSYAAEQFICLWPNPIVFKAQLDGTPTGKSYASVTFGGTISGDPADIEIGMRVIIGPNDDVQDAIRRARQNDQGFDGRVRAARSGFTLPINETSAELEDTFYLWVIEDYPVLDKLKRVSGNSILVDWDETFAQLPPIIGNLSTAYAGVVNSSDVLEVDFAPTAIAGTDGASITGWQYTIPTGGTITTGTATSQNITVEFDPGTYIVTLVVTDGTRSWTRRVYVFAVPANFASAVSLVFDGAEITGDIEDGYSATVSAFAGIDAVYDNTLCVIFDRVYADGSAASIVTELRMVGRLRTETDTMRPDEASGPLMETRFDIEGAGLQLGRVKGPILTLIDDTSPTAWDEIDKATYWRVIAHVLQRHSTFLTTHSLAFSDTTDNYRLSRWGTNGADMLSEVNQLADSIGASIEFAPDGRTQVNRRGTQLSDAGRDALVTVAALTNVDGIEFSIERDHVQQVGLVNANGGTFSTNNNKVQSYLSHAPGTARGPGPDDKPLVGQVLLINQAKAAAEAELNTRTGNFFAEENPQDIMTVTMPDGWRFLIPSRAQWYTWTLSDDDTNLRGISYDTNIRWWLRSLTVRQDNALGAGPVEAVFVRETKGSQGETIPPPPKSSISIPMPAIPPIIGIPDLGDIDLGDYLTDLPPFYNEPIYPTPNPNEIEGLPADGNAVIYHNSSSVWYTTNFKSVGHDAIEITPSLQSGHTVQHAVIGFGKEVYVLTNDGTSSYVYYAENGFVLAPSWVESAEIAGVFNTIEVTSTQGDVFLYGSNTGDAIDWDDDYWLSKTYAVNVSGGGGPGAQYPVNLEVYAGGIGLYIETVTTGNSLSMRYEGIINADTVMTGNAAIASGTNNHLFCAAEVTGAFPGFTRINLCRTGRLQGSVSVPKAVYYDGDVTTNVSGTIRVIVQKSLQAFPGGGSGSASLAYSDDYGATWSTASLGDTPGAFGGAAPTPIGDLILAGYDGQVAESDSTLTTTDYGSAVPTGAQPSCIVIPRYTFGSTTVNNATSAPEYLLVSDTLTGSNEAMWKVTASGATFTDITPHDGTNYGLAVGPHCAAMHWRSGNIIAAVLQFGSARKLAVSTDAGSNWDFELLDDDALMVTFRKGNPGMMELYISNGNPAFSPDRGDTISVKAFPGDPSTDPLLGIDVYA